MLEAHPLANLFPMLDAADADVLRGDISEHGLQDPVTLYDGKILDGRNRYRALAEIAKLGLFLYHGAVTEADLLPGSLGAKAIGLYVEFEGSEAEALEFVLSKNLHRRHLTDGQRAMVAANLATLGQGRPEKNRQMAGISQDQAAGRLHVSKRQVERAVVVRDHGIDELNDAVQRGELKVSLAAQLARMSTDDQREVLAKHADRRALSGIAKDMRADKQREKADKRQEREKALGAKQQALPDKKYGVILADPEWKYKAWSVETGSDRSPDNHYPCSELDDIKARPVGDIAADDCALFLWVTTPFLEFGFEVMRAWGFAYKSSIVWGKERVGDGRGPGYWFLGEHETVLFGTRGNVPAPTPGTQFPSFFLAPVGEHSVKPDTVHEIAEAYFPNMPKIELNARRKRAGWDAWGNEADGGEGDEDCLEQETLGPAGERYRIPESLRDEATPVDADALPQGEGLYPSQEAVALDDANAAAASETPSLSGEAVSPAFDADAVTIDTLTGSLAVALGVAPSLGTGNGRTATADERRLRRAVIVAAHDQHGMSTNRIGTVLGIKKQSVHEQIQAARAK